MNYLVQLNSYLEFSTQRSIPSNAQCLYYKLLQINNKCGWKRTFTVANITLQILCAISRSELHKMRNQLVQIGLIKYQKGKGSQAGAYTIVYLYETESETQAETQGETEVETFRRNNSNTLVKKRLKEIEKKETKTKHYPEASLTQEMEDVVAVFNRNIRLITSLELKALKDWRSYGMKGCLLTKAIEIAVFANKPNMLYINSLLKMWTKAGIKTLKDLEQLPAYSENQKKEAIINEPGNPTIGKPVTLDESQFLYEE